MGVFFEGGIKEARKHTDDLSRTSPMKIQKTECRLLQEERKRDGRGEEEKRREGGEGKVGEKKKRRKSGDPFFAVAPLDWDFLCVFGHSEMPVHSSDGGKLVTVLRSPPPFPSLTVGIPCNYMR